MDYITERAHTIFQLAHGGGVPTDGDIVLYRIYAVLSLSKGLGTTARDVHDAWAAWISTAYPDHRSLKPFDQLPEDTKRMDDAYVLAIHRASEGDN